MYPKDQIIAFEQAGMRRYEAGEAGRPDFLFAFDEEFDVDPKTAGGQQCADRAHERNHLRFHIRCAARKQIVAALRGCERCGIPLGQRVGRLDVIVTVEQYCWFAGCMQPVRINHRVALRFKQLHVLHADAAQLACHPVCCAAGIGVAFAEGGDAGYRAERN